jgi:hypothetical protein
MQALHHDGGDIVWQSHPPDKVLMSFAFEAVQHMCAFVSALQAP